MRRGFSRRSPAPDVEALRQDLAAVFRLTARFDWHLSVGTHFSAAVAGNGRTFLMNPRGTHPEAMRASDLLLIRAGDEGTVSGDDAPDASACCIHAAIHRKRPSVRVILHCHPPYSTALASLKDPSMPSIDRFTARFSGRIGIDTNFSGIADDMAEARRLAGVIGSHCVLLRGNHGVTVTGPGVAEAFEHLCSFERAARSLLLAYSTGRPLAILREDQTRRMAEEGIPSAQATRAHFHHLKSTLDAADPTWRQ